jgi:prepilin-type N-terminal cleavage/methylation domain-containing protein
MRKNRKGFTLIEMLVSVALFSMVMVVGLGALLTLIAQNRQAQAFNSAITNLNFALESMSRTIRTGTTYKCGSGGDCLASGIGQITVTSQTGQVTTFAYSATDKALYRCLATTCTTLNQVRLTSPNVTISYARFYIDGSVPKSGGNTVQPYVIITLVGDVVTQQGNIQSFAIETTVTQRLIDL